MKHFGDHLVDRLIATRWRVAIAVHASFWLLFAANLLIGVALEGRTYHIITTALVPGAVGSVLVWLVLLLVKQRRHQIEERLNLVADLNHHIRNNLQPIVIFTHLHGNKELASNVNSCVTRIDTIMKQLIPIVDDKLLERRRFARRVTVQNTEWHAGIEEESKAASTGGENAV